MSQSILINPSAFAAGIEEVFQEGAPYEERRLAAFERFAKTGFPNRRAEGWKWSDFDAVLRKTPVRSDSVQPSFSQSLFAELEPYEVCINNGRITLPAVASHTGIKFEYIDALLAAPGLEYHPFANLNSAMTQKAVSIEFAEDAEIVRPIHIRHTNYGAGAVFSQIILKIGASASARIIETYEGDSEGLYSHLLHVEMGSRAAFQRTVLDHTGKNSVIHALCALTAGEGGKFEQTSLSTGAKLTRHETHLHLTGAGATASIDSAAMLSEKTHADFTTQVLHSAPGCNVRQLHKSVAAESARTVFQGKFKVEPAAQKTDAKMTANALLLSSQAEANHKPELEIYADDVECAHGSTIGALDENALFYLRQRGLDEEAAKSLLIEAFLGEVFTSMENDVIREKMYQISREWTQKS